GISGLSVRLLEGSLRFMDSEVSASSLRRNLLESGILTLTYLDDLQSGGTAARRPAADDRKKAFGRGYQMDFRLGFGLSGLGKVSYTKGVQRVVNSLREVDLQKRSATEISQSSWACSSETVFMIVRPEDLGKTVFCNKTLDPLAPLDKDRLALESLRRVLRPEDWWVDLDRRCIIPKQNIGSCYGNENPQQPLNIKYDGGDCIAEGKSCPHYVSICVRQ
ncbi:MAG: hypothetical protein KDD35_09720, partial [Bdellovibrionales bacterium]|nr:hypothetical protein [Bdellovibrionales bacterium]